LTGVSDSADCGRFTASLFHNQHRARRSSDNGLGYAAKQSSFETGSTVCGHDDQLRLFVFSETHDLIRCVSVANKQPMLIWNVWIRGQNPMEHSIQFLMVGL
jgi:hypothetical protein